MHIARARIVAFLAFCVVLEPVVRQSAVATGTAHPGTPQTSIQHVVIILKENRSFDQYFGAFPGADGATTGVEHDGTVVPLTPPSEPLPNDLGHSATQFAIAYDGGKMDGFDLEDGAFSQTGDNLAYTEMTQSQIPNYWAYAERYALGDHMFTDFHGASFGNNVASVLAWIQYNSGNLERRVKEMIDQKVREGVVKPKEGVDLQNFYEAVLNGYTYMDYEKPAPIPSVAVVPTLLEDEKQKALRPTGNA